MVPNAADYDHNIDYYLAHGPFDVIHFNWGLHDLKHGGIPLTDYLGNLNVLVDRMEATGATLIFAYDDAGTTKEQNQAHPRKRPKV